MRITAVGAINLDGRFLCGFDRIDRTEPLIISGDLTGLGGQTEAQRLVDQVRKLIAAP